MSPELQDEFRDRVINYCSAKNFQAARDLCQSKFSESNTDVEKARFLFWLAYVEKRSGYEIKEREILNEAKNLDPNSRAVLYSLALLDLQSQNYSACIATSQKIIKLEENKAEKPFTQSSLFHLAFASLKQDKSSTFINAIEKVENSHEEWILGKLWSKTEMIKSFHLDSRTT